MGSVAVAAIHLVACGGTSELVSPPEAAATEIPGTLEVKGRLFLREDRWAQSELERIAYEGRPELPSTSREVLAAQLRAHVVNKNGHFIEVEPNLDLADRVLSGRVAGQRREPTLPREPRTVVGALGSDGRSHATGSNTQYPNTTFAFEEIGCSGIKIGTRTLYTAAHCFYRLPTSTKPKGWYCRNGTVQSNPNNCTVGRPRWRFGVEDAGGYSNWLDNCFTVAITTAFLGLSAPVSISDYWLKTRWDYAAVDLDASCATESTGALGAWTIGDSELNVILRAFGYPARANCPVGAQGTVGTRAASGAVQGSDCPGTGNWPGSTWRLSGGSSSGAVPPWSGSELWGMNISGSAPGDQQGAYTIKLFHDVTQGQSGGPVYYKDDTGRWVVGVISSSATNYNMAQRFTPETWEWFEENTDWPGDG